jgi:hypothetical protein
VNTVEPGMTGRSRTQHEWRETNISPPYSTTASIFPFIFQSPDKYGRSSTTYFLNLPITADHSLGWVFSPMYFSLHSCSVIQRPTNPRVCMSHGTVRMGDNLYSSISIIPRTDKLPSVSYVGSLAGSPLQIVEPNIIPSQPPIHHDCWVET